MKEFEGRPLTRREVLIAREAFVAGSIWRNANGFTHRTCLGATDLEQDTAKDRYPLPKVTRPRVVQDDDSVEWRIADGAFEHRWTTQHPNSNRTNYWVRGVGGMYLTDNRVRVLFELISNPTEECEVDE